MSADIWRQRVQKNAGPHTKKISPSELRPCSLDDSRSAVYGQWRCNVRSLRLCL